MTWQPIETAPKDGKPLLLGYLDQTGKFSARSAVWYTYVFRNYHKQFWYCSMAGTVLDQRATHWMPLPEPPNA